MMSDKHTPKDWIKELEADEFLIKVAKAIAWYESIELFSAPVGRLFNAAQKLSGMKYHLGEMVARAAGEYEVSYNMRKTRFVSVMSESGGSNRELRENEAETAVALLRTEEIRCKTVHLHLRNKLDAINTIIELCRSSISFQKQEMK